MSSGGMGTLAGDGQWKEIWNSWSDYKNRNFRVNLLCMGKIKKQWCKFMTHGENRETFA